MIKVIYAMVNDEMPEDFVDDLFLQRGSMKLCYLFSVIAEVNGRNAGISGAPLHFIQARAAHSIIVQNPENFYIHGFVLTAMKHFLRKGTFRLAYLFSARISAVTENIL